MPQEFLFVTGAPRSGTTYISDWLTQLDDAYCVHEVLTDLKGKPSEDAFAALNAYASSGADRLDKVRQREFLSWPSEGLEARDLELLAWKEPVAWAGGGLDAVPDPLGTLLRTRCNQAVVTVRHPFDVVASGRRREAATSNWRPLSVEAHCAYWLSTLQLIRDLELQGCDVLVLRWEGLLADPSAHAVRLGKFVKRELPAFEGYEREPEELVSMRACVHPEGGLVGHASRMYLTKSDTQEIHRLLQAEATELGYDLADL
ncbi:hypothetical protein [Streptomyces drozdowiczii]|uniref:Sulfotransferase n=1 Tax=Streptomyces drozdowiczii TaxID=202862 RepID=A0ABY6PQ72_9ACTN|nr:hypothetical protein [Streptomyces drozdowiczii]MCX0246591.1 hypothetical protein [Streptomyces drozdowiczii]UZK53931.1 hypothetical protein NEH16_06970 [Streptomyces drozdowiczii]